MRILATTLMLLVSAAPAAAQTTADEILAVLQDTAAGWNAGDLGRYMQGYWRSADLRFASGGTVTYGWEATLERYRARYPDKAAMGILTFSDLDVELLGDDAACVFGAWELQRAEDRPHGLFTLVFRRLPEGWRIVHDHTSSAD